MAAFFTNLLPQFGTMDAGPSFWLMLALGLLFCLLTGLWLVLYATAIHRLGAVLRRSRVRRSIEAVTRTLSPHRSSPLGRPGTSARFTVCSASRQRSRMQRRTGATTPRQASPGIGLSR
jgi:hypothetical protein